MKFGVVSDVHNNVAALRYALDYLHTCAAVFSLGDLVSEYSVSPEIIRLARAAGVVGIRGNHEKTILLHSGSTLRERMAPDDLAYLRALPSTRELHIDGRTVKLAHGAPWDDPADSRCQYIFPRDAAALARLGQTPADVILLGHTHVPMSVEVDQRLVLNPGTCGEARAGSGGLSFAELDFGAGTARIFRLRPGQPPDPFVTIDF